MGKEWALAAFSALATVLGSYILVRASRRDRAQDELAQIKDQGQENAEDIAHIEGHLETKTGYRPRNK